MAYTMTKQQLKVAKKELSYWTSEQGMNEVEIGYDDFSLYVTFDLDIYYSEPYCGYRMELGRSLYLDAEVCMEDGETIHLDWEQEEELKEVLS